MLFFPRLMNFKFFLGLKLVQIKLILYFLHPSGVSLNSLFPYGTFLHLKIILNMIIFKCKVRYS
jgi:hypothetical protein